MKIHNAKQNNKSPNHVLDADWGFAGAQPQPGQHHVRNLQFGGTVMKVFISWSGELSHKVARIFRDWLPNVVQILEPYVSSEDIDKGNGVTS